MKLGRDHLADFGPCPWCGYDLDAHALAGGDGDDLSEPPAPGDGAICIDCGGPMIFDQVPPSGFPPPADAWPLRLRQASLGEAMEIMAAQPEAYPAWMGATGKSPRGPWPF